MLLKILQISQNRKAPMLKFLFNKIACLKACNFIREKLQHCEIFKSVCSEKNLRTTASVYLKSKLQKMQFTHKPKTFNFRLYKVFSNLFSFAIFSSTKFTLAFESFSLKMYIGSAKTYYFCMFVCFAFIFAPMYAFIWYQTCTLSEHSKTEFHFKRSKNGIG